MYVKKAHDVEIIKNLKYLRPLTLHAHHPLYDVGIYFIFYDDGNSVSIDLLKGSFQNKRSLADNGKLRGFVLRYIYTVPFYIFIIL